MKNDFLTSFILAEVGDLPQNSHALTLIMTEGGGRGYICPDLFYIHYKIKLPQINLSDTFLNFYILAWMFSFSP